MGMREEIEALPRYGCEFEYVRLADLRRIIDKHAAPVVDMTKGGVLHIPILPINEQDDKDIEGILDRIYQKKKRTPL